MSNKKTIINNIFSLGSIEILGLLIPIISMPLLTNALGPSLYGQYLLIMTILAFGNTIIDYGAQYSGVRAVSKNINKKKIIAFLYSHYQAIRLFFSIIYIIIISLYFIFVSNKMVVYIWASLIPYVLGYFLSSPWFFLSINKTKMLLISTFFTKIITLLFILFYLKTPEDFILLLYFTSFPSLISGVILFVYLQKYYNIKIVKPTYFFYYLKNGWNIFIGILAPNFYNSIPTIILGGYSNPIQFAKFAIASRICSIIITFQDVFAKAIYPIITQKIGNYLRKILYVNIFFSIISIIIVISVGNYLLSFLIGKELAYDNIYINIISISILFNGITNALSKGYFLPNSYDIIYRNISIRISIFSALLSYFLIYEYNILGGAIAITIARLLFAFDYSFTYIKMKKNNI